MVAGPVAVLKEWQCVGDEVDDDDDREDTNSNDNNSSNSNNSLLRYA